MTADNYQTIFELGFRSFPWPRVVQPFIFLIIGLLFVRLFQGEKFYFIVGILVASTASIFLLISLVIVIPDFVKLRSAYMSGKGAVVTGVVQKFQPAPAIGPARESFSINEALFSYNVLDDTPCFHNSPLHSGPIHEGLNVRIHFFEGCIQRVEVLK